MKTTIALKLTTINLTVHFVRKQIFVLHHSEDKKNQSGNLK